MFGFIDLLSCIILVVFFIVVFQYLTGFSLSRYLNKYTRRIGASGNNSDPIDWYTEDDYRSRNYRGCSSEDMIDRYQLLCHQLNMARRKIEILQAEIQDLDDENQRLYNTHRKLKKYYKRYRDKLRQFKTNNVMHAGLELRSIGTLSPDEVISPAESTTKFLVPVRNSDSLNAPL